MNLQKQRAENAGQEHVLKFFNGLNNAEKEAFTKQLTRIDYDLISSIAKDTLNKTDNSSGEKITPAPVISLPKNENENIAFIAARSSGEVALSNGRVAGGQATRLGYNAPKGMFPLGPISERSLFQYFAEQILATAKKYETTIPWYIMTSTGNHSDTKKYFEENNFFGLCEDDVWFFPQSLIQSVDGKGKLLLDTTSHICENPNGHGGSLMALHDSGALEDMKNRGIEFISYFQVDNPLVTALDPVFIGFHNLKNSEMSAKVLRKRDAGEKVGVASIVNGKTGIVEYSDLPENLASATDENGEMLFWAGSIAIHIMSRRFLERITADGVQLPWHLAHKKIPYLNEEGVLITPNEPNAYKFETFVFDALGLAENTLFLEVAREEEFAPVKNPTGVDSADSSRQAMSDIALRWCNEANVNVKGEELLEISPLYALDSKEFASKIKGTTTITTPHIFE